MRLTINLVVMVFLLVGVYSHAGYASENQALIRNAIATVGQRKPDLPLLVRAAETGDKDAQFYLAETLKLSSGYMKSQAHSWYEKSAKQGDMYSMYRLSNLNQDVCSIIGNCPAELTAPKTWGAVLLEVARDKAQQGDGEGMEMMYTITGDLDWLVKAADAGYSSAQNWLAVRYGWGDGWFFWPGQREKEIARLYRDAAEGGYPRAISQHAGDLLLKGDIEGAQTWLMKGVALSHVPAVGAYAYNLDHGKYYHFEQNPQLAYALYLVLSEIGGGTGDASDYAIEELKPKLTPSQIAKAIEQARIWKETHPPLSYHPPKLEFW
nr:hypothetical protein [uncultured Pseudomonas sp.]